MTQEQFIKNIEFAKRSIEINWEKSQKVAPNEVTLMKVFVNSNVMKLYVKLAGKRDIYTQTSFKYVNLRKRELNKFRDYCIKHKAYIDFN